MAHVKEKPSTERPFCCTCSDTERDEDCPVHGECDNPWPALEEAAQLEAHGLDCYGSLS